MSQPGSISLTSRILGPLKAFALGYAANEVAAATPHVEKALEDVPADLKASDPVAALLATANAAWASMKADPAVVPSLTGLLGALAAAFV